MIKPYLLSLQTSLLAGNRPPILCLKVLEHFKLFTEL